MTLVENQQRDRVLRIWRNTEAFSRDLIALVMQVPDEDQGAFDELLQDWLYWMAEHDEAWTFDPNAHTLPSDALEDFWQEHSPLREYNGSDLEGEVLAYRAQRARTRKELSRVLDRMYEHVRGRSGDKVGRYLGFFHSLEVAVSNENFEPASAAAPQLRAVA